MMRSNKKLIIIISILLFILVTVLVTILIYKKVESDKIKLAKKRKEIYENAVSYCNSLYKDNLVKDNVTIKELDTCLDKMELVYNKDSILSNKNDAYRAKEYINLNNKVNTYYKNNIVISSIKEDDINKLNEESSKLDEKYKGIIQNRINDLKSEYDNINNTQNNVHNLFSEYDNNVVVDNINRDIYNEVKAQVDLLKQEDIKIPLNDKLNIVLTKVEEKEAIEREQERIRLEQLIIERERRAQEEAERKRQINEAWVKLNVPYISQNRNGVLNGCEAASMLMALQFKGYLGGIDLYTYATNMPKSDNPNTGFYLDIFGKEPMDVAHWIAPTPLVEYGISSSGNNNISNISGASIDDIANEIVNGNPVIIYLTYAYNNPVNWSNGVPRNIHVQLIVGYNKITGDFIIYDPWTRSSGQYEFTLSKNKISNLYSSVGSMAIVVR